MIKSTIMDKYIVINRTVYEKELALIESEYMSVKGNDDADEHFLDGRRTSIVDVLDNSIPLEDVVEKAFIAGSCITDGKNVFDVGDISGVMSIDTYGWKLKTTPEEFITQLKLDI